MAFACAMAVLAAAAGAAEGRIAAVSAADIAPADARIEAMRRDGRLAETYTREDALLAGRTHERLAQRHKGLPVWGAEVTRQRGAGGTVSVFGRLYDIPADLDIKPAVSPEGARAIAAQLADGDVRGALDPEPLVFPKDDGSFALAWHVGAWGPSGRRAYIIDARTGGELLRYDGQWTQVAQTGLGTGVLGDRKKMSVGLLSGRNVSVDAQRPPLIVTYDMKGDFIRTLAFFTTFDAPLTSNDVATDSDNDWTDGAVVDAHTYAGWTYDYYFKVHNRRGLDGADLPIRSIVNPALRENFFRQAPIVSDFFLNAFWDTFDRLMLYGVGAPIPLNLGLGSQNVNHLAGSLDVVAHELTHGVTQFSSNLIYRDESGALNEAFSDIMSVSVQFYFDYPSANYIVGDEVVTPANAATTPAGFRSLANPMGWRDPDHYSIRFTGTTDNGGVHTNSMIPGHAFYLAVEGGTNRYSGLRVTGVGAANRQKVEKAFFRAFTRMLTRSATFLEARAATIQSARDLYGTGDASVTAITQAWDAVGVR